MASTTTTRRAHVAWRWAKVLLVVIGLDLTLFGTGAFWRALPPPPPSERDPFLALRSSGPYLYRAAAHIETAAPGATAIVGSSVVLMGVDDQTLRTRLEADGVGNGLIKVGVPGLKARNSALLTNATLRAAPWLVVLGTGMRDYTKPNEDPAVTETFYDSSIEFAGEERTSIREQVAALLRSHSGLYRYRILMRDRLAGEARSWWKSLRSSRETRRPPRRRATARFPPGAMTRPAMRAWRRWQSDPVFARYLDYLRTRSGNLFIHRRLHFDTKRHQLASNPAVDALRTALASARRAGARIVVVQFPQNPAFRVPEARPFFDPRGSDMVAAMLSGVASEHGARFVDLRSVLEAADFYDLIHPNLAGTRKITRALADVIEEEWSAAGGSS